MSVDIASIGRINMDIIMEVENLPAVNGHAISKESQFSFGGSASNFATQSSRLGVKTGLISCVGDDIYGQMALKNLSDRGVNTESILVLENQPTGLFFMAQDLKQGSMVLVQPNHQVKTALNLFGLQEFFPIADDLSAGLKALGSK